MVKHTFDSIIYRVRQGDHLGLALRQAVISSHPGKQPTSCLYYREMRNRANQQLWSTMA